MKPGAVIVDVGIDQSRCIETSKAMTHQHPTYVIDGVVHYCVTNMPGAVGRTSTQAMCHATQSYVIRLADEGVDELVRHDPGFAAALNMRDGKITHIAVAEAHGIACGSPDVLQRNRADTTEVAEGDESRQELCDAGMT